MQIFVFDETVKGPTDLVKAAVHRVFICSNVKMGFVTFLFVLL